MATEHLDRSLQLRLLIQRQIYPTTGVSASDKSKTLPLPFLPSIPAILHLSLEPAKPIVPHDFTRWPDNDLLDPTPLTAYIPLEKQPKLEAQENDDGVIFTALSQIPGSWNSWPSGLFAMDISAEDFKQTKKLQLRQFVTGISAIGDVLVSFAVRIQTVKWSAVLEPAQQYRNLFSQDDDCPPTSDIKAVNRFICQKAWERLVNYTGCTTDGNPKPDAVDIDMEALILLEMQMFDRSEDAGVAGNHQWGLDVEGEKNSHEGNESELEVGPNFDQEELVKWHRDQLDKQEVERKAQKVTYPKPKYAGYYWTKM
ncbi:hypothetical protein IW261DRAFT_1578103 [Armillaria novae-zelandiae]|uniref:Uncharacterized protein n=1 Tax=Armillaria novae-zelandiae TaxID=153914 RepID=A0AA39KHB3_9AGAR|nr:hypothetical protein IW261DRAFT_1578103 [Armillaria novae-zelandiae]